MAYRSALPAEVKHVHLTTLIVCCRSKCHIIEVEPIEVGKNLAYKERRIQVLDCKVKQLNNKRIPLVKVLWANHTSSEAT